MNKPDKHSDEGNTLKHVCLLHSIYESLLQWHMWQSRVEIKHYFICVLWQSSYALHRPIRYFAACMSSAFNGSSALQCFEHGNTVENKIWILPGTATYSECWSSWQHVCHEKYLSAMDKYIMVLPTYLHYMQVKHLMRNYPSYSLLTLHWAQYIKPNLLKFFREFICIHVIVSCSNQSLLHCSRVCWVNK